MRRRCWPRRRCCCLEVTALQQQLARLLASSHRSACFPFYFGDAGQFCEEEDRRAGARAVRTDGRRPRQWDQRLASVRGDDGGSERRGRAKAAANKSAASGEYGRGQMNLEQGETAAGQRRPHDRPLRGAKNRTSTSVTISCPSLQGGKRGRARAIGGLCGPFG